jgi:steroid delta-isomerase-like uncharacterized protein
MARAPTRFSASKGVISIGVSAASESREIEPKEIVRRVVTEGWNRNDWSVVERACHPDMVFHANGPPVEPNINGLRSVFEMVHEAFPDFRLDIDALLGTDEYVSARMDMTGTHRGSFMGLPPTGRPINVSETNVYRFREGKLDELWATPDVMRMLVQLGYAGDGPPPLALMRFYRFTQRLRGR